jgi:signal transduction histidine kinase
VPFREVNHDASLLATHPLRVLVIVAAVMFVVEGLLMLILPRLPFTDERVLALIDASALVAATVPALWFLVLVPVRRMYGYRGKLLQKMFQVHEEERARLASDLHDEVGQHLTTVIVGLRTIEDADSLDIAMERARHVRQSASIGLDEVRRLVRGLRPGVLDDLGLVAAIERLCEDFEMAHSVRVTLTVDIDDLQRHPMVDTALYRMLQEALTNVARHANASQVEVVLTTHEGGIFMRVADNGCGVPPVTLDEARTGRRSIGVLSMQERTRLLGGMMTFASAPGQGTTVEITLPRASVASP